MKHDLGSMDKTPFEKVHLKFCKYYLGVLSKATELGRFPLKILIGQKILGFVKHLGEMNNNALAKQASLLSEELRSKKQVCFLTNIDKILKSYDIDNSIDDFQSLSSPSIKQYVTKTKTSYVNLWRASKQNTRKLVFYNTFKKEFKPEGCLDRIKHISARKQFAKFRISNHQLQIETGRYRTDKTFNTNRICQPFIVSLPLL